MQIVNYVKGVVVQNSPSYEKTEHTSQLFGLTASVANAAENAFVGIRKLPDGVGSKIVAAKSIALINVPFEAVKLKENVGKTIEAPEKKWKFFCGLNVLGNVGNISEGVVTGIESAAYYGARVPQQVSKIAGPLSYAAVGLSVSTVVTSSWSLGRSITKLQAFNQAKTHAEKIEVVHPAKPEWTEKLFGVMSEDQKKKVLTTNPFESDNVDAAIQKRMQEQVALKVAEVAIAVLSFVGGVLLLYAAAPVIWAAVTVGLIFTLGVIAMDVWSSRKLDRTIAALS